MENTIFTSMSGEEWIMEYEDIEEGFNLQELLLCFHEQFE
jgi:hypothetical protein